ncbi:MAG: hypothetical protein ACFCD0_14600 [Gemmataceae bacterium]
MSQAIGGVEFLSAVHLHTHISGDCKFGHLVPLFPENPYLPESISTKKPPSEPRPLGVVTWGLAHWDFQNEILRVTSGVPKEDVWLGSKKVCLTPRDVSENTTISSQVVADQMTIRFRRSGKARFPEIQSLVAKGKNVTVESDARVVDIDRQLCSFTYRSGKTVAYTGSGDKMILHFGSTRIIGTHFRCKAGARWKVYGRKNNPARIERGGTVVKSRVLTFHPNEASSQN